jgi:hypothetical protein
MDWQEPPEDHPPNLIRRNVDEMRTMAGQALRLLNETAVPAGVLYQRLQRLDVCMRAAIRFISDSDRGEQMRGQYEDLQIARELRIALDDAQAALALIKVA